MQIILASSSLRRRQLLSYLIDKFTVISSHVNEKALSKLARLPEELVVKLAKAKAKEVGKRLAICDRDREKLMIGSDLIVVLERENNWQALSKPKDINQAREMLKKLRGKSHKVFTGICVLNTKTKQLIIDFDISEISFKEFPDEVMEEYLATGKSLDRAGAYGIQDLDERYIQEIKGSYTNIIGLPLSKLARILKAFKVEVKPNWQKDVKHNLGAI